MQPLVVACVALVTALFGFCAPSDAGSQPSQTFSPVTVELPQTAGAGSEGARGFRVLNGHSEELEADRLQGEQGRITIDSGCATGATYVVELGGVISEPFEVMPGACDLVGDSAPRFFTKTVLSGRLEPPEGASLPTSGLLVAAGCPREQSMINDDAFAILIADDGSWKASVPAGCTSWTLRTRDLAPHTWFGLEPDPQGELRLPTARLKTGASLLVRVVADHDSLPVERAELYLVPAQKFEEAASRATRGRRVKGVARGASSKEGWVRLSGLARGRYHLVGWAPGFAPTFSHELELATGDDLTADDLRLVRPAQLEVSVSISSQVSESLTIADRLQIDVMPIVAERWISTGVQSKPLPPDGVVRFDNLPPAKWLVWLMAYDEQRMGSELSQEEILLTSGATHQVSFDLDGQLHRGVVARGDAPVEANLRFEKSTGEAESSASFEARSDSDGGFNIFLPAAGRYRVLVVTISPYSRLTVDVEVPDDPAELIRIRLPGGSIEGTVVTRDGAPVAEAKVIAARVSWRTESTGADYSSSSSTARHDGSFVVDGLAAGEWSLRAHKDDLSSMSEVVRLGEDESLAGITIVITTMTSLGGVVVSATGEPVVNAGIAASIPPRNAAEFTPLRHTRTDTEGRFTLEIPSADAAEAHLMITPVNHPLDAFRVPIEENLFIQLRPMGGDLLLRPQTSPPQATGLVLVAEDGSLFSPLVPGAAEVGGHGHILIRNLAVREWRLVRVSSPQEAMLCLNFGGQQLPAIATVVPSPGQVLEVVVPGASEQQQ